MADHSLSYAEGVLRIWENSLSEDEQVQSIGKKFQISSRNRYHGLPKLNLNNYFLNQCDSREKSILRV